MANLSGQTIQSTYPGLLNLNTATTGITSTLQQITDGYGNNTGTRISIDNLKNPNLLNFYSEWTPDYGGVGITPGVGANPAAIQNRLIFGFSWDSGFNSYSAVTVNLNTVTSSSDVVSLSFYTIQYVDGFGIAPKDLIVSGISIPSTGSTGLREVTLANNLSFSSITSGWYGYAFIVSNAGVTPTVRYTNRQGSIGQLTSLDSLGYTKNSTNTALQPATRLSIPSLALTVFSSILSSYTASDITSGFINAAPNPWGFGLNTVK